MMPEELEVIQKPKFKPLRISKGDTIKLSTPCGNMYLTVNFSNYPENLNQPFEIFLRYGKCGGCIASVSEVLGRIISLSLQSGTSLKKIIKQLKGIRCANFIDEEKLSCFDVIGKELERYVSK